MLSMLLAQRRIRRLVAEQQCSGGKYTEVPLRYVCSAQCPVFDEAATAYTEANWSYLREQEYKSVALHCTLRDLATMLQVVITTLVFLFLMMF